MITEVQDERQNLPSASGIPRIMLCRGSWNAERGLPEDKSTDAKVGTEHHKAFETGDDSGLSDEAKDVQAAAREIEQQMVADWLISIGREHLTEHREERLWIYEKEKNVCSAKLDYFAISGPYALIIDLKTGRNEVTPVAENWQLRTQAIAVFNNYGIGTITVGIVQPGKVHEPFEYTAKSLSPIIDELFEALAEAHDPNARRTPGEAQCKYCRARATCPEANAVVKIVSKCKLLDFRWGHVSREEKVQWFTSFKLAKVVIKEIESRIKADLEADPKSIPGLTLEESRGDRKVIDVNAIFNELEYLREAEGLKIGPMALREVFQAACSLPVGKLTALVKEVTSWKTKDVETWLTEHCDDWIKRGEPSKSVVIDKHATLDKR